VQLHLLRDQTVLTPEDPDALVDFAPRTLAPGESLMLVATVDPGPCVMPNPPDAGGGFSLTEMPIAYDVLGWPRTFHAPFWNPVELAAASSCPG
jgi:hypothetical protein